MDQKEILSQIAHDQDVLIQKLRAECAALRERVEKLEWAYETNNLYLSTLIDSVYSDVKFNLESMYDIYASARRAAGLED